MKQTLVNTSHKYLKSFEDFQKVPKKNTQYESELAEITWKL